MPPVMRNGKPYGMFQSAYVAFLAAGNDTQRIVHTVDTDAHHVPASGHTHYPSGVDAWGDPCSAATDYSTLGDTPEQKAEFVQRNGLHGIAVFIREQGKNGWNGVDHAHFIYCGVPMRIEDRNQIHAWCNNRNGLATGGPLGYPPSQDAVNACRALFLAHNPVTG